MSHLIPFKFMNMYITGGILVSPGVLVFLAKSEGSITESLRTHITLAALQRVSDGCFIFVTKADGFS